jgi:hypothetical protein
LTPYVALESNDDELHARVVQALLKFAYTPSKIELSLQTVACDDAYATYRFLETKVKKLRGKRRQLPRCHSDGFMNKAKSSDTTFSPVKPEDGASPGNNIFVFFSLTSYLLPYFHFGRYVCIFISCRGYCNHGRFELF